MMLPRARRYNEPARGGPGDRAADDGGRDSGHRTLERVFRCRPRRGRPRRAVPSRPRRGNAASDRRIAIAREADPDAEPPSGRLPRVAASSMPRRDPMRRPGPAIAAAVAVALGGGRTAVATAGARPATGAPPRSQPMARVGAVRRPAGPAKGAADRASAPQRIDGPAPSRAGSPTSAARLRRGRARRAPGGRDALRAAQRDYDEHVDQAEAGGADPRTVRAAKEAAQAAVPRRPPRPADAGRARGRGSRLADRDQPDQPRNARGGRAGRSAHRARPSSSPRPGATGVEADAARISAESAEEACVAAREARRRVRGGRRAITAASGSRTQSPPSAAAAGSAPPPVGRGARRRRRRRWRSRAGEDAVILRLLRGDARPCNRLVARLAGDDIERPAALAALDRRARRGPRRPLDRGVRVRLPDDHPFWGAFTQSQARDIAAALVVARLPPRRLRWLGRRARSPSAARPVARRWLRGPRPDAHPALAGRGRRCTTCCGRSPSPPTSTSGEAAGA